METIKSPSTPSNGHAPLSSSSENFSSQESSENMLTSTHPRVERVASSAHQAVDKLAGSANRAAQTLGVKTVQVKDAQERMAEELRVYVRNNPMTSVGIAVAAGFLLSRLINL
jgi:ElaB/YqjD/DUF883 family membrane-anchored ribosome-binding protein